MEPKKEVRAVVDVATDVFRQPPERLNCAQAVLVAAAQHGLAAERPVEEWRGMGRGNAPGGTCGALYAAMELVPEARRKISEAFEQEAGSTLCRKLKEQTSAMPCEQSVALAAALLAENASVKTGGEG